MVDTKAKTDLETAAKDTKAKAADTIDAAADTADAAKDTVKSVFSKALEDAKASALASASALSKKAHEQTDAYREKLAAADLVGEAKALGTEAKARAAVLATDGKAKASDALTSLGKVVAENAGLVDDKLGAKYGDYARSAARSIQETAAKLEAKDLGELGEEAKTFVRKSPALALGIAAVAGFLVARALTGSSDEEA
jgi:ElaB/YqjD/DUF883 family membrane-anchored ribosome-binding protein